MFQHHFFKLYIRPQLTSKLVMMLHIMIIYRYFKVRLQVYTEERQQTNVKTTFKLHTNITLRFMTSLCKLNVAHKKGNLTWMK